MIRSYTVDELERMSGVTRRTISDYISKGLLAGPSHRGRGARYPQADADALRVVPRIRTLMKKEFPTVDSVASFLRDISSRELRNLACQPSEKELVLEARRIRVRLTLAALMPKLTPERLSDVVDSLSPDQISGIDKGQYQLGAVLDLAELFSESGAPMETSSAEESYSSHVQSTDGGEPAMASRRASNGNGEHRGEFETILEQAEAAIEERRSPESRLRLVKPSNQVLASETVASTPNLDSRLTDIAQRLDRLEHLLSES